MKSTAWPSWWKQDAEWRRTYAHLVWLHGDERGGEIVRGTDVETNADLGAWRFIGRG